ncbi:MAG: hypothetical protein COB04_03380 [Gammaproteobacteria bacterium]|nr:MAG: hypothetical protein COB04_03380 [Gammaproteobacteria bacterium]
MKNGAENKNARIILILRVNFNGLGAVWGLLLDTRGCNKKSGPRSVKFEWRRNFLWIECQKNNEFWRIHCSNCFVFGSWFLLMR